MFCIWQPSGPPPNPNTEKIRRLYSQGVDTAALAERFRLSRRRIQDIVDGISAEGIGPAPWAKRWGHKKSS